MGETILGYVGQLDVTVVRFFSDAGQISPFMNKFVIGFLNLNTVKFLPLITLLWFLWFREGANEKDRGGVIGAFIAMLAAVAFSRLIQDVVPTRPRPVHSPGLDFVWPLGINHDIMENWSSFPSDHAAQAFAIATAIFFISRRWAVVAFLWAVLVVCLPRVFAGWHYTSDAVGGALVGIAMAYFVSRSGVVARFLTGPALRFEKAQSGLFYAASFVLSYQIVTLFDDVRKIGRELAEWLIHRTL
ncbi:phosphatase PAP2 family protein [Microvirga sp. 2MCAF38]|uniref:phosphatase PAP2 family protein n=1 Tax=Microvirga sp. 2MCAF38 TaxID=3232989 RepID=UPI003F992155